MPCGIFFNIRKITQMHIFHIDKETSQISFYCWVA